MERKYEEADYEREMKLVKLMDGGEEEGVENQEEYDYG